MFPHITTQEIHQAISRKLSDDIERLLPELQELVEGWAPSWDFQDVKETAEEEQQRSEWATMQTALELLQATLCHMSRIATEQEHA
jgi:hypothetical protein